MNKLICTFASLLLLFSSCNYSRQYINQTEDKEDAEKVTNHYYDFVLQQQFDSIVKLCSQHFLEHTDEERFKKILNKTFDKLGALKKTDLIHWETRRVIGSNPLSEYYFIYESTYERSIAKEQFRLVREEDSVIRIISYQINSDRFLD